MKKIVLIMILSFLLSPAQAKESTLKLSKAKIYEMIKGSSATAGFANFKNNSDKPVKLKVLSSPAFKAVELHEMATINGMMKMQKMDSFKIAPRSSFILESGGYHLMLFNPTRKFKKGEKIKVKFNIDGKIKLFSFDVVSRL